MSADLRADLHRELTARTAPAVLAEAAVAFGVPADRPFPPVEAYVLEVTDRFLTLTAVSQQRLVRFEMTVDGRVLHVTVPLHRVSRVAEAVEAGTATVVVEVDADRRTVSIVGASAPAEGTDGAEMRLEATMLPAAFVVTGTGDDLARVREFARRLRAALAH